MGAAGQNPGAELGWGPERLGGRQAGAAEVEAAGVKGQVETRSWCCLDVSQEGDPSASKGRQLLVGHPTAWSWGTGWGGDLVLGSREPLRETPSNGGEGAEGADSRVMGGTLHSCHG